MPPASVSRGRVLHPVPGKIRKQAVLSGTLRVAGPGLLAGPGVAPLRVTKRVQKRAKLFASLNTRGNSAASL